MGNLFCCYRLGDKKFKGTSVKTLLRRAEKPSRRRKRIDELVTDFLKREQREERYEKRKYLKAKSGGDIYPGLISGSSKDTFGHTTTRNLENHIKNDLSRSLGAEKKSQGSDPTLEYKEQEVGLINAAHTKVDSTGSHFENCGNISTSKAQGSELSGNSSDDFLPQNCIVDKVPGHATPDSQSDIDNSLSKVKTEFLENDDCLKKENTTSNESEVVLTEHFISDSRDGCTSLSRNTDITGQKDVRENDAGILDESRVMSDNTNNDLIVDEMESETDHTDDRDKTSYIDHKTDLDLCGEERDRKDGCNGSSFVVADATSAADDNDVMVKESDIGKEMYADDKITEITDFDSGIAKNDQAMDDDQTENTDIGNDKQSYDFATDSDRKMKGQNIAGECDIEEHDLRIDSYKGTEKENSVFESDELNPKKDMVDESAEGNELSLKAKAEKVAKDLDGSSSFASFNLDVSVDDGTGEVSSVDLINADMASKGDLDISCSDNSTNARGFEDQGHCWEDGSFEDRQIHTNGEVGTARKSAPEVTIVHYQDQYEIGNEHAGSNLSDGELNKNQRKVTGGIGKTEDTNTLVPVEVIPKVYSTVSETNCENLSGFRKGSENTEVIGKSPAELIRASKAMPIRQCTGVVAQAAKEIKFNQHTPFTSSQNQFPGHNFLPKSSKLFSKTMVKVLKSAKRPIQTKGHTKHAWSGVGVIDCIMKVGQKPQVKEIDRLKKDPLNQPIRMRKLSEQDRHGSIEDLKWSRHMRAEIRREALRESDAKPRNKCGSMAYTGNNLPRVTSPLRCQSPTPGCSSTSSRIKKATIQCLRNRYGLPVNPCSNGNLTPRSPNCDSKLSKSRPFFTDETNHSADTSKTYKRKEVLQSVVKQLVKSYKEAEARKASRLGTAPTDDTPNFGIRRHTSLMDLSDISSDKNC